MRAVVRRLAVFGVVGSVLLGLGLPLVESAEPFDADAHVGAPVPAEHATQQFEQTRPPQPTRHCLICHFLSSLSTVVTRARVTLVAPSAVRLAALALAESRHDRFALRHPSLRGPPAVS